MCEVKHKWIFHYALLGSESSVMKEFVIVADCSVVTLSERDSGSLVFGLRKCNCSPFQGVSVVLSDAHGMDGNHPQHRHESVPPDHSWWPEIPFQGHCSWEEWSMFNVGLSWGPWSICAYTGMERGTGLIFTLLIIITQWTRYDNFYFIEAGGNWGSVIATGQGLLWLPWLT